MRTLLLVLLFAVPARAEAVLYTSLTEHDGILDVDGYEFYFRDVIPSTPHWLWEAPAILFFVSTYEGISRWTYYDGLSVNPGVAPDSAWVYRDMQPVDDETMMDANGRLLYVEHDYPVGVPEPSTWLLLGMGMAGLLVGPKFSQKYL